MADVPEPPTPERTGFANVLYAQICQLKPGAALKAEFEADSHAAYIRTKLRGLARKEKRFLASSQSVDGKTRYFWFEKLERV